MPTLDPAPKWERFYPDRVVGAHVLVFDEVDSTMDVARESARAGAPHGAVVRAATQRSGRGRFARRWESGPGDSLLTSVVLRMPPVDVGAPLSVAGSLAVHDAVAELLAVPCGIKWPNDVQVGGKKIAGVLVESQITTDGTGFAILGIGLNVNLTPDAFAGIGETATSLAIESGGPMDLDHVEETLLRHLDKALADLVVGTALIVERWRTHLSTLGTQIAVHMRDGVVEGEAVDVDEQGALLLRDSRGTVHRLLEGDVTLRA
ncbi:MAG: biotin--[acetyl-CoA-carboxylase] ligase [Chloroflexi bacterium]|nr:biotin--[acetyl-CoA-carboxylase] ligase [Chloroflexota bacterium]MDA1174465.1 biotin--[acetyl-CoA-carboxylase] ligase [Chloroflexota bacterium]